MMLAKIKKLSNSTGHLRDFIELLNTEWRARPQALQLLLQESVDSWTEYERIPVALRVILTENNDPQFRAVVRAVCDSAKVGDVEKQPLYLVCALWGDAWASEFHLNFLRKELHRALTSASPDLSRLLWALLSGAMLGQYGPQADLERIRLRLDQMGEGNSEYSGMVDALLELLRDGPDALAQRLRLTIERGKVSEVDLKACFILGAMGQRKYAPLFLEAVREVKKSDWWSAGVRHHAMASHGYSTAFGAETHAMVEERLQTWQTRFASWWSGGSWTSDLIAICAILWNMSGSLGDRIVTMLRAIAEGSYRENAKYATALLILKGLEIPSGAKFTREDREIRAEIDFLQYDCTLNFAYYWRCREGKAAQPKGRA